MPTDKNGRELHTGDWVTYARSTWRVADAELGTGLILIEDTWDTKAVPALATTWKESTS